MLRKMIQFGTFNTCFGRAMKINFTDPKKILKISPSLSLNRILLTCVFPVVASGVWLGGRE